MSENSHIRWGESDKQRVNREIKNFNAKIDRQIKKGVNINALPEKISMKQIKEVETRKDLKRIEKDLKVFTRRGAENIIENDYGVQTTEWEIKRQKSRSKSINISRSSQKKKNRAPTLAGKEIDKLNDINYQKKKFNFEKMSSYKNFEKFKESTEKQIQSNYHLKVGKDYFNNYQKAISQNFNSRQQDKIFNLMNKIGIDNFYKLLRNDKAGTIDFTYDPIERQKKFEAICETMESAIELKEK